MFSYIEIFVNVLVLNQLIVLHNSIALQIEEYEQKKAGLNVGTHTVCLARMGRFGQSETNVLHKTSMKQHLHRVYPREWGYWPNYSIPQTRLQYPQIPNPQIQKAELQNFQINAQNG